MLEAKLSFEDLHRKLRFGWDLLRTGSTRFPKYSLINREERVLHPVGKTIRIAPQVVREANKLKALEIIGGDTTQQVLQLKEEWQMPLDER